jgi:hypothetical protein
VDLRCLSILEFQSNIRGIDVQILPSQEPVADSEPV